MADNRTADVKIPLGSGYIYIAEYKGSIPADEAIETADNLFGYVQKGATIVYKPEKKTIKDDMGHVSRTITTSEEATLKCGFIAWSVKKLPQLVATGRKATVGNKTTIKIGGISNDDGLRYVVRFVHPDKELGDLRITIVGTNTAGLSLAYAMEEGTLLEPEFTAEPCDGEGTLIIMEETAPTVSA